MLNFEAVDSSMLAHPPETVSYNPFLHADPDELVTRLLSLLPTSGSRPLMTGPRPVDGPIPGPDAKPIYEFLAADRHLSVRVGQLGTGAALMSESLAKRLPGIRLVVRPTMRVLRGWASSGTRGDFYPDGGSGCEYGLTLSEVLRSGVDGVLEFTWQLGAAGEDPVILKALAHRLMAEALENTALNSTALHVIVDFVEKEFIDSSLIENFVYSWRMLGDTSLHIHTDKLEFLSATVLRQATLLMAFQGPRRQEWLDALEPPECSQSEIFPALQSLRKDEFYCWNRANDLPERNVFTLGGV